MITMTEIGKGLYVKTEDVKFVVALDRKSATSTRIRRDAAMNEKLFYNSSKLKSKCFVVMTDNTIYYTAFNAETVAEKLKDHGKKLLVVDTDVFISVQHIKAVSDMNVSKLVNTSPNQETEGSELQFLRKGERKETELMMESGERVRLSKLAKDCILEINANQ